MHNVGPVTLLKNLEAITPQLYEVVRIEDKTIIFNTAVRIPLQTAFEAFEAGWGVPGHTIT